MKEFREIEELQEFKNGNASKNAVIVNNATDRAATLRHFTTASLHFFTGSCGVAARVDAVKTPTTPNLSPT